MKALEKDRSRRYETASALAADVRRFLNHEPIEARPPSTWYRFSKLARRNKVALTTAAVVAAAMVLGTAVSLWQAVRATRAEARQKIAADKATAEADRAVAAEKQARDERNRAMKAEAQTRTEADKSKAINDFLVNDLLIQAEPLYNAAEDHVTLLEILDRAAAKVGERFASQPEVETALRSSIAQTYHGLGSWKKAELHWRAVQKLAQRPGADLADVCRASGELAHVMSHRGRHDEEVLAMARSAAEGLARLLGPDHLDTLLMHAKLATAYLAAGRANEAIPLFQSTLEKMDSTPGPDVYTKIATRTNLATAYKEAGRTDEAISLLESVLKQNESVLTPDYRGLLAIRSNLASAYRTAGRTPEAIALYEATLKQLESRLGPNHPDTLAVGTNLALAYQGAGRTANSIALHERTLKLAESSLGPDDPATLRTVHNLAHSLERTRPGDAEPLLRRALAFYRKTQGPDGPLTLDLTRDLAMLLDRTGRHAEAVPFLRELLERQRAQTAGDRGPLASTLTIFGANLLRSKNGPRPSCCFASP